MQPNLRGGNQYITLTKANLPPHSHNLGVAAFYHKYGGGEFQGGKVVQGGTY